MKKSWTYCTTDPETERSLCSGLSVGAVTARVLQHRGLHDVEEARRFIAAETSEFVDPHVFASMGRAVERIFDAIRRKAPIVVYGDYDVDGLTGACLLHRLLRTLGAKSEVFIPDRLHDGYGLNPNGMEWLLRQRPDLLITVDHGVTAFDQVATLQAQGIDVIVTDHHQKPDQLPAAHTLLNPLFLEEEAAQGLSGAGVAFKLACALFQASPSEQRRQPRIRNALHDALAFAALGTIADLVPLRGENRIVVRHGLARLRETELPGLAALRDQVVHGSRPLDTEDVSFGIAPRLNAAGRLGRVHLSRDLLLCDSVPEARRLARELESNNLERRELQARVTELALSLASQQDPESPVLVLAHEEFHQGVVGIVAARLVDDYSKPALLLTLDEGSARGSGRAPAGFDLAKSLRAVSRHLRSHGGHAAAAGMELDPANIDAFRDDLMTYARSTNAAPPEKSLNIVSEVQLHQLDSRLLKELSLVGPFGEGNPRPVFAVSGVEHAAPPRRVGQDGSHLLMKLRYPKRPISAIAFRQGHRLKEVESGELSLAFRLLPSTFAGQPAVQLQVEDLHSTSMAEESSESTAS